MIIRKKYKAALTGFKLWWNMSCGCLLLTLREYRKGTDFNNLGKSNGYWEGYVDKTILDLTWFRDWSKRWIRW